MVETKCKAKADSNIRFCEGRGNIRSSHLRNVALLLLSPHCTTISGPFQASAMRVQKMEKMAKKASSSSTSNTFTRAPLGSSSSQERLLPPQQFGPAQIPQLFQPQQRVDRRPAADSNPFGKPSHPYPPIYEQLPQQSFDDEVSGAPYSYVYDDDHDNGDEEDDLEYSHEEIPAEHLGNEVAGSPALSSSFGENVSETWGNGSSNGASGSYWTQSNLSENRQHGASGVTDVSQWTYATGTSAATGATGYSTATASTYASTTASEAAAYAAEPCLPCPCIPALHDAAPRTPQLNQILSAPWRWCLCAACVLCGGATTAIGGVCAVNPVFRNTVTGLLHHPSTSYKGNYHPKYTNSAVLGAGAGGSTSTGTATVSADDPNAAKQKFQGHYSPFCTNNKADYDTWFKKGGKERFGKDAHNIVGGCMVVPGDDRNSWKNEGIWQCTVDGFSNPSDKTQPAYSYACAHCIGDFGECARDNCMWPCVSQGSESKACIDCGQHNCGQQFLQCTGLRTEDFVTTTPGAHVPTTPAPVTTTTPTSEQKKPFLGGSSRAAVGDGTEGGDDDTENHKGESDKQSTTNDDDGVAQEEMTQEKMQDQMPALPTVAVPTIAPARETTATGGAIVGATKGGSEKALHV